MVTLLPVLVLGIGLTATAAKAEVVTGLPGGTWSVLPDTTAGGTASIVAGPGTPPAGTGSLRLTVATAADRVLVGTDLGQPLPRPWGGLSAEYSTFVPEGSPASFTPTLRIAGFQVIAPAPAQFTTLSFEPSRNGTVVPGQWQTWTLGPTSVVWQTNATDGFCVQATPCTLAQFVAQYPGGAWGQAQLGIGSGVAGPAEGFADAVTIRDGAQVLFTDFDPVPPPASPSPTPSPEESPQEILPVTGHSSRDVTGLGLAAAVLILLGTGLVVLAARRSRS